MRYSFLLSLALLFILTACDNANDFASDSKLDYDTTELSEESMQEISYQDADGSQEVTVDRKLIKNGDITFETKSVTESQKQLLALVKQHSGYVSNQSQNSYGERISYQMEVRVVATQFDELYTDVLDVADRLESQNIRVNDVTEEFIDVQARLQTKRDLEVRYRTILSKATTVEEILSIEREIGNLTADVESLEGRLKYLTDQTRMSTLNLHFYERSNSDFGFGGKLTSAFSNGWQFMLSFLIGLITLWPFILLGVLVFLLVRRKAVFRKKRHE